MSNMKRTGHTAHYERLSCDDDQGADPEMQGEINPVANQEQLLESYEKRNGFLNIYPYTDDLCNSLHKKKKKELYHWDIEQIVFKI